MKLDPSLLVIVALALGAMWLMTSRTRKQQRQAGDFRANLEVDQEVMTGSGYFGTIVDIDGDTITLESTPGTQSRWIRAAIAKVVEPVEDEYDDEDVDEEVDEDVEDLDVEDSDYDATDDDAVAADDVATDDDAATDDDVVSADDVVIDVPDDLSSLAPKMKKDTDKK